MPDLLLDRVVAAIGDRYDVEGELGTGGMAVVYRARDVRLRRPVALKVLPPDLAFREGVRARFLREAETAAQLSHPHIVPIYAADETAGVAWLAMALVEGETLGARMHRESRMSAADVRRILAEVADALAYAHARGVVHRDIKPDNILLDAENGRAVVTDFGIARAAEADQRLTLTGIAVGTPAYMSPEQALGEREVDGRSDLYSLGVVGYQMLAGAPPFSATSAASLLLKHVGERPTPIAQHRPDIPAPLAQAIDRALAKKPEARWSDAAAFRQALLAQGASSRPVSSAVVPDVPPDARPVVRTTPRAPAIPPIRPPPSPAAPPNYPTAPLDWRDQRDEWKERLREQRREWRERRRETKDQEAAWKDARRAAQRDPFGAAARAGVPAPWSPNGLPDGMPGAMPGAMPFVPLERGAEIFRRRVYRSIALVAFLFFINLVTAAASRAPVPWVIFPALGIFMGLRRRWRPFAREGVSFGDVMSGRAARRAATWSGVRPADQVRRLHRRLTLAVVSMFGAALSFIGGMASRHDDPWVAFLVVFTIVGVFSVLSALRAARRLRRMGIPVRDALSSRWADKIALVDPRPRETILVEEASRLASADVLAGAHGRAVRGAVDDRLTVRETLAKLSPADRALLPKDVLTTIDDLVAKVAGLAQSLHRLEGDVSPTQLDQLEVRVRAAERQPEAAPDRERQLQLLQRQRASLLELLERRDALAAQLESAQLVLQNIKLDLIKLRSSGVGAGLGDVSNATQEARALSRDIKYALDAVAEVRGA